MEHSSLKTGSYFDKDVNVLINSWVGVACLAKKCAQTSRQSVGIHLDAAHMLYLHIQCTCTCFACTDIVHAHNICTCTYAVLAHMLYVLICHTFKYIVHAHTTRTRNLPPVNMRLFSSCCRFFTEQNNRLFQTLIDVSASMDRQLTSDHMKSMGLDPVGDRSFLMELVETYGIDVILMVDNPCCPR